MNRISVPPTSQDNRRYICWPDKLANAWAHPCPPARPSARKHHAPQQDPSPTTGMAYHCFVGFQVVAGAQTWTVGMTGAAVAAAARRAKASFMAGGDEGWADLCVTTRQRGPRGRSKVDKSL